MNQPYLIWGIPWQLVTTIGSMFLAFVGMFAGQYLKHWLDMRRDNELRKDQTKSHLMMLRGVIISNHKYTRTLQVLDFKEFKAGAITKVISDIVGDPFNYREDIREITSPKILGAYSLATSMHQTMKIYTVSIENPDKIISDENAMGLEETLKNILESYTDLENKIAEELKIPPSLELPETSIYL